MHNEAIRAYRRRLLILRIKAAYFGLDCPPHILMEIEDIRAFLKKEKNRLSTETLYNEGWAFSELHCC